MKAIRGFTIFLALAVSGPVDAAERMLPFWPDEIPATIHAHVDGVAALETVRELSRYHRVQGSPGFARAAEHLKTKLLAAGLNDVRIHRYPADGVTKYAHFRSYYGWTAEEGILEELDPAPRLIAAFPRLPVALADYSQDSDVTAELVDVGAGIVAADYEGKSIEGKIVLADGPLPRVHRLAVEERKAAGFLSAYPNQTTAWSGDDRDLVRWGHLSPYNLDNTFAFMVSKRQAARFRERFESGEKITLRARVKARMTPGTFDIVDAVIPGTDLAQEEIVFTAHLCHQSAGANDNASGSAAILEVARSLGAAIRTGKLPVPRRTIRFLWLPEMAGSQAYLASNPQVARRMVAGIHMDMVGGLLSTTRGTFHLARTAESLPHVANAIARVWLDHLTAATERFAEGGGDPYAGFVWPPGSREVFLADLRGIEMGSDHQVFEESSYAVPMLYFHDWPDTTIHTNKDQPENLDATKLGRVVYLGAGIAWTLAALPDSLAGRLLEVAEAEAGIRMAEARLRAARVASELDASLIERESVLVSIETLETVAAMWPSVAARTSRAILRLERILPESSGSSPRDVRVPERSPSIRGPVNVYYYDHFAEVLGPDADSDTALSKRPEGGVLAFEALNLVDGKRSISDIRDILTGRYASIPVTELSSHFELLEQAGVVRLPPRIAFVEENPALTYDPGSLAGLDDLDDLDDEVLGYAQPTEAATGVADCVSGPHAGPSCPQPVADEADWHLDPPEGAAFWAGQCGTSADGLAGFFEEIANRSKAFDECAPIGCSTLVQDEDDGDIRSHALRELLALWLNTVSGRLADGATAQESIARLEPTLCDPASTSEDLRKATALAEGINTGSRTP